MYSLYRVPSIVLSYVINNNNIFQQPHDHHHGRRRLHPPPFNPPPHLFYYHYIDARKYSSRIDMQNHAGNGRR